MLHTRGNQRTLPLTITAAALWATFPIFVSYTTTTQTNPYTYLLYHLLALTITHTTYLLTRHKNLITQPRIWSHSIKQLTTQPGLRSVTVMFSAVAFIAATQYIDTSITVIIANTYFFGLILTRQKLDRNTNRYHTLTNTQIAGTATGVAATTLVILAEHGTINPKTGPTGTLLGIGLAALTAILATQESHRLKLGEQSHTRFSNPTTRGTTTELGHVLITTLTTNTAALTLIAAPLIATGTWRTLPTLWIWLAITAGTLDGIGGLIFRYAAVKTKNLSSLTTMYLSPAITLTALTALQRIQVPRPDYLLLGIIGLTAAIVIVSQTPKQKQRRTRQHLKR